MVRVLIVDDDRAIRETLRLALEDEGYAVVEAPDGVVALDALHASPVPMVVLLDLRMPRLDGAEVLARVAADPVLSTRHAYILVTANLHTAPITFSGLLNRLMVPVMPKPFDLDALMEVVAHSAYRLIPAEADLPPSAHHS